MNPQILQILHTLETYSISRGAAHRKERAPQDFVNRGSVKSILLFERNCLCCLYGVKRFEIYNGDILIVDLLNKYFEDNSVLHAKPM